jgi:chromosome partitioning protein
MPRVIAIANHKGGVGKTTTSYNLAHALARYGHTKVLLCDVDPQAMLTKLLDVQPHLLSATLANLLVPLATPPAREQVIHETAIGGVSLLPGSPELAHIELQLATKINRELTLRRALEAFSDFDFILLDCPPDLNLLNTNALAAAHHVLIPVSSESMTLEALKDFRTTLEEVRRELNPTLTHRILVTKHEPKTSHARAMLAALQNAYPDELYQAIVPYSVRAKDAAAAHESVLTFAPKSTVAEAYSRLADEITDRAPATQPTAAINEITHHA